MRYILSEPHGIRILMMTRPIEKVERRSTLQITVLIWDIINALLFGMAAIILFAEGWDHDIYGIEVLNCLVAVFILVTILFYFLTMIDPGYVPKQQNFIKLLQRLLQEQYHLDYICVHCEALRPENAEHCNFCNKCV